MNRSKNILLLAGTGAIGKYLSELNKNQGYNVFVTSRRKRISHDNSIVYMCGNAKSKNFLKKILHNQKFDVIVDFINYKNNEFNRNIDTLLKSCNHYFFLSSCRVYRNSNQEIDESFALKQPNYKNFIDSYASNKISQEKVLHKKNNSKWTIVRPYITYSTNRLQLGPFEYNEIFSRSKINQPMPFTKKIMNNKTILTWGGDVAKLISQLYQNKNAYHETFNLVSDEAVTWKYVYNIYKNNLNTCIRIISNSELTKIFNNSSIISYDRNYSRMISNKKIRKCLNLKKNFFKPLKIGLVEEINQSTKKTYYYSYINGCIDYVLGSKKIRWNNIKLNLNCMKYIISKTIIDKLLHKIIK